MSDSNHSVAASLATVVGNDPRVTESTVRTVDGDGAPVVLVGVVHDHPASVHRAAAVVEAVDPETVAVELPDLVVPAIDGVGSDVEGDDEARGDAGAAEAIGDGAVAVENPGGEMAAAAAVATGAVAGIDIPGRGTVRPLLAELRDRRADPSTVARALADVAGIGVQATLGRLAGLDGPGLPDLEDVAETHEYDVPSDAPPAVQADHERAHLRRSSALLRNFEPPAATALLDGVRERYMAAELRTARRRGTVVAVVGYGHLDAVETALKNGVG